MISNIFYLTGLIVLFFSFSNLINFLKFNKIRFWAKTFKKVIKKDVDRSDFKTNEEYNIFIIYSLFSFLEILWILFGLATNSLHHWVVFLTLLFLNIIMRLIYKYSNFFITNLFGFIFSLLKFSTILIIILNYFHFQQDILNLLR
jgi:hypothetical protein